MAAETDLTLRPDKVSTSVAVGLPLSNVMVIVATEEVTKTDNIVMSFERPPIEPTPGSNSKPAGSEKVIVPVPEPVPPPRSTLFAFCSAIEMAESV